MKKKQLFFCMGLSAIALLSSCNEREFDVKPSNGHDNAELGKIVLNLNSDASFGAQTRALNEDDYRKISNYQVQVYSNDNPSNLIVDCKYSDLDAVMPSSFNPGTYTVKAFYGTEQNYSRNEFYVEGVKDNVTVNAGNSTSVTLNCLPTSGKLNVEFDSEMTKYYESYDVSFSQAAALGSSTLVFDASNTEPWYVKLNVGGETLRYTINLTAKDEYAYTDAQGNIKTNGTVSKEFFLERNRSYKLKIKPDYTSTSEGGLKITIEIDDNTNEPIDVPIEVPIDWL